MKITDLENYKVVGSESSVKTPKDSRDGLAKTSDTLGAIFPGTKTIGESIGTLGIATGQAVKGDFGGAKQTLDTMPSVPRLIGAYTAAGATAAGTAGVGTAGGVISRALSAAGLGAAQSGGATMAEGNGAKDIAKNALTGAAIGGGLSLAASGAEKMLKSIADSLPERLIHSATGQSKKEILAGKDITKYILENKKVGTTQQLIDQAQKEIDNADGFIGSALASETTKTISIKDLTEDIAKKIGDAGGDINAVEVRQALKDLAPQVAKKLDSDVLSLTDANKLRSQLDKVLGSNAFISAQLPFKKSILMDFTNGLRNNVKDAAPTGVREAFNTYAKEIRLRDLLLAKQAGASRNQVIGLGDILFGGFGGAGGGIPGAMGAVALRRATESTLAKTGGAVLIQKLDDFLSPVLEQLEPTVRTQIVNTIVHAIQQSQESEQTQTAQ